MSADFNNPVPAIADPGIIVRYSVNLGEQDRVLQFEGALDRDAVLGEYNALADKLRLVGSRQRAIHMLPTYRRQLRLQEEKHLENQARAAEVKARIDALKAARGTKAAELRKEASDRHNAAAVEWAASGRRGEFKPQGALRGELDRLNREIEALSENQTKDANEAQQQLSVLDNEVKEGERQIGHLKALIAEAEAMARCEDVSGIAEE